VDLKGYDVFVTVLSATKFTIVGSSWVYDGPISEFARKCTGIEVHIKRNQEAQALFLPSFLCMILNGEFVPTLESPNFDSACFRSLILRDVTSC
jgi:hypothetical protein